MSRQKLTKVEALKLIAPVIDNEVTEKKREAFLRYINRHKDVKRKYESMKRVKALIASRCPKEKAPDQLKKNVSKIIADSAHSDPVTSNRQTADTAASNSSSQKSNLRKYAAAAGILIVIVVWSVVQFSTSSSQKKPVYNVEEYAFEHFKKHHGTFVPPTISTASIGSAETELADKYNLTVTVPELKNADFKGIVYTNFVPGFKTPMLEYHLPSDDEYAYVFAFSMDQMEAFGGLHRNKEAMKTCNQPGDFYVCTIKGKHVVSWKWDNVWYTAISNHKGSALASLVKPLDSSLNNNL